MFNINNNHNHRKIKSRYMCIECRSLLALHPFGVIPFRYRKSERERERGKPGEEIERQEF